MGGTYTILKKEFLDNIGEAKFLLLFFTLLVVVAASAISGAQSYKLQANSQGIPQGNGTSGRPGEIPGQGGNFRIGLMLNSLSQAITPIVENIAIVGGLLAVTLSFDAINKERSSGSLKVLLSYPIYRDQVLIGKFLGGFLTILVVAFSTVAVAIGIFSYMAGLALTTEILLRILSFMLMTIIYLSVFLVGGLLFSIVIDEPATSLLASIVFVLAGVVLITNLGSSVATLIAGSPYNFVTQTGNTGGTVVRAQANQLYQGIVTVFNYLSPSTVYQNAVSMVMRTTTMSFEQGTPVSVTTPFSQAFMDMLKMVPILIVWFIVLAAGTYMGFRRKEIT